MPPPTAFSPGSQVSSIKTREALPYVPVALAGLILSIVVIPTLATTTFLASNEGKTLPGLQLGGGMTGIALISGIVGYSSASLSRRDVTRLELRPKQPSTRSHRGIAQRKHSLNSSARLSRKSDRNPFA